MQKILQAKKGNIISNQQVLKEGDNISTKALKSSNLNGIYKDMAEVLGIEVTIKIYKNYKGLQVTFPTRLLAKEYVIEQANKEYNGKNIKQLAIKYSYSERWLRQMLKEKGDEND
jgi:Mor family transcriptional regulator